MSKIITIIVVIAGVALVLLHVDVVAALTTGGAECWHGWVVCSLLYLVCILTLVR